MANGDRIYRRTPAGQSAWDTREALPTPLRRVLSMVDADTHAHVVCKRLRSHEESTVTDWLSQLERMGLVESAASKREHDLDFTGSFDFRK
jgi:hypothetical protein